MLTCSGGHKQLNEVTSQDPFEKTIRVYYHFQIYTSSSLHFMISPGMWKNTVKEKVNESMKDWPKKMMEN